MSKKTLPEIAEQMAEAIREWNRAKREREEWKPVPGMVPPAKYLDNARKANVLLTQALEEYEAFQQSAHPTDDGLWLCSKCQIVNDVGRDDCYVCGRARLSG